VHLVVDSAVALKNLESTLISPGVVPGVNAEPVVLVILDAPSNALDGVASLGGTGHVLVNTGLVGEEIFVDGEGSGDWSVGHDLGLDVFDTLDGVAGGTEVLVASILNSGVAGAGVEALGLVSGNIVARDKALNSDVVSALRHSVVIAELTLAVVAARNNTCALEPSPGGGNLATIATEGEALGTVTAGCGVRNWEKFLESSTRNNALAVIESFSGTMGPAGTAVGLVTNVVNDGLALGPGLTSIEVSGNVHVGGVVLLKVGGNSPFGINDGAHKLADFLVGGSSELVIHTSGPGSSGVVVDKLNVRGKILGALSK
jgi:hypothetical protein